MKDTLETKDIYNKVEKIVTATHLVAGIMPKSEPMHLALRQESLKLMSSSLYNESLPDQQHIGHFVSAVDSCMSLTKIALATGLITDMNAKWLMKGYAIIKDIYQSRAATVVDLEQYDIKDTLMATVKDNQATKPSPVFNILKTSKVQSVIPGPAIMPDRLQGNSVSISTTAADGKRVGYLERKHPIQAQYRVPPERCD